MRPVIFSKQLAAAVSAGLAASQSLAAAGDLTLNGSLVVGGVGVLDTQRRVIITSAGNDSGITWTVKGTNQSGAPITDVFAGGDAAAAQSNLDFLTVTSIYGSGATASTVTAGTNTVGSSEWRMPSSYVTPFILDIETFPGSGVTYNVEYTQSNFYGAPGQADSPMRSYADPPNVVAALSAATTQKSTQLTYPVRGWRVTITAGTSALEVEALQGGIIQ